MSTSDETFMRTAIELARRGEGCVEPNPMVGCVLVRDGQIIGEGWHQEFGGPHAEVNAIQSANQSAPDNARGATAFVTLEPCCHAGKTGPCVTALIDAGVSRVVVAHPDPNPLVNGKGIDQLKAAGIEVTCGILENESAALLAPFLKRQLHSKPWIIAKWAMSLDGKIATSTGDSQWISNKESRAIVHQIRGRVDGIMVGIGTALADDPMLTARPAGKRTATRIIVDSAARIPVESKLVQTAREVPTLLAVGPEADVGKCDQLRTLGCEVFQSNSRDANQRLEELLSHLSEQGMTNVLVEGGGKLLGSLNDIGQIDELHVFIGPKIIGGEGSTSPIGGIGHDQMMDSEALDISKVEQIGNDVYLVGRVKR